MAGIQVRFTHTVKAFRSLEFHHVCVFQTFGIITSAFLCRKIRDMQVDWKNRAQGTKRDEKQFHVSVGFARKSNALFWRFIRSFPTTLTGKYAIGRTTMRAIITGQFPRNLAGKFERSRIAGRRGSFLFKRKKERKSHPEGRKICPKIESCACSKPSESFPSQNVYFTVEYRIERERVNGINYSVHKTLLRCGIGVFHSNTRVELVTILLRIGFYNRGTI